MPLDLGGGRHIDLVDVIDRGSPSQELQQVPRSVRDAEDLGADPYPAPAGAAS